MREGCFFAPLLQDKLYAISFYLFAACEWTDFCVFCWVASCSCCSENWLCGPDVNLQSTWNIPLKVKFPEHVKYYWIWGQETRGQKLVPHFSSSVCLMWLSRLFKSTCLQALLLLNMTFFPELPHVTSIEWVTLTLTIMSHINSKCKPYVGLCVWFFPPLILHMASCYFLNADLNLNPVQHLNISLGWGAM